MKRRGGSAVLVFSALFHGALGWSVVRVERPPPPAPPPIKITVRDVPPPSEPEPPPPPEPEPPPPEPEAPPAPEAPPEPAAEPPPQPPAPAPKKARPEPPKPAEAPPAQAPAADVPDFGLQLGNGGSGPGGVPVPQGDPGGAPGGGKPREKAETKKRTLDAKPKPASDGCTEPEVKPKPLELPQPQYTDAARAAGIEGKVRVQLTVGVDGGVREAKVVSALDPGLDAAALAAVKSARFAPATRCGQPVAATLTISIKFSL